tara:strand:+ start:2800 stop:3885 length:1086 start_codon:yes stop_codon:yes gene_type:complete
MKKYDHISLLDYEFETNLDGLDFHILENILSFMKLLRRTEERIAKEYHPEDKMRCPVHLCIGQEGIPGILSVTTTEDDYLFSHHRSHGHYLAKRGSLNGLISELYGTKDGVNHGLAGSQDISSPSNNFYAGAIVAGTIGIAVGAATAQIELVNNTRVFCCFGEAATEQGIFWEAINFAALKKLPIIFICENNRYATYSDLAARWATKDLCQKVNAFGVPSQQIFGNDIVSSYRAITHILNNSESFPYFFEALTYRISSHVGPEDDSINYRTKNEINLWKTLCPIKNIEKVLGQKTDTIDSRTYESIDKELDKAFERARQGQHLAVQNWESLNLYHNTSDLPEFDPDEITGTIASDTIPGPY